MGSAFAVQLGGPQLRWLDHRLHLKPAAAIVYAAAFKLMGSGSGGNVLMDPSRALP
jgi:hypothetical protein